MKEIVATEYADDIYNITNVAYQQYPEKYRPTIYEAEFKKSLSDWKNYKVYGAFYRESQVLCGYSWLKEHDSYIDFCVQKVIPRYEKFGINAAIVEKIIEDFNPRLGNGFYICDGARATLHETSFQDYLEKYFGFRKAYCNLHIKYRFPVNMIVGIIYPFRNLISKEGKISSKIKTVLFYEQVVRNCKHRQN